MVRNSLIFVVSMVALAAASLAEAQEVQLQNSAGFIYDIDLVNGDLDDGQHQPTDRSDACDGCWELEVDESNFSSESATYALGGREVRLGPVVISDLQVSRRIYVPTDANFVRYLDILHNPTGSPITVRVVMYGNLGSDGNTTLRGTSADADLVLDTNDDWMISSDDDPDGGDPVMMHLFQGPDAALRIDAIELANNYSWSWDEVEVPAGGTVALMFVGAMHLNVADAVAAAQNFHGGGNCHLLIRGMTQAETATIANWDISDDDGDGLPDCWETAYGLNPGNNNTSGDPDGDGLTNLEEFQLGTSPTNPDTDGDGLSDGDEVDVYDTDPFNPDSDGDSIPDGAEVAIGLDPNSHQFFALNNVLVTSGESVRQSDVAVDGTGQVHVTWISRDPAGPESTQSHGSAYVWYRQFDADGVPLADAEKVALIEGRAPSIAVDSTGQAFIAWHGSSGSGVWLGIPGLTTPTGAGVPQTDIEGPILISESGQHVRIAVDGDDNIHAVWRESGEGYAIYYAKFSSHGDVLVSNTLLAEEVDWNLSLNFALDPNGNLHVVWTDDEFDCCPASAYYLMADGTDGAVLIDRTPLYPSSGEQQRHSDVVVDALGRVHIIWSDRALEGVFEVFYTRIDPSLHDQDGSAGDIETIATVAPKRLTDDNGLNSHYSTVSIDGDGNLMMLRTGEVTSESESGTRLGPLWVQRFDVTGNPVTPPLSLYSTDDTNSIVLRPYARGSEGWVTWVEGTGEVYVQNANLPEPPVAPNGQATVTTSAGAIVVAETLAVTVLPAAAQASAPSGFAFPDGLVRVVVTNLTPGASITVTVTFPSVIPANATYYKWSASGGWVVFPFTRTANPNQAVLTLTDGGAGDADGVANGVIADPGGPAIPTAPPPPPAVPVTSRGSGGGGCTITTGGRSVDPLLPLLLLLALAGLLRRRSLQGGLS